MILVTLILASTKYFIDEMHLAMKFHQKRDIYIIDKVILISEDICKYQIKGLEAIFDDTVWKKEDAVGNQQINIY